VTAKTQPAVGDLLYLFRELADLDRDGDPVNTGLKLVVMTFIVVKVHKLFTILHCQRSDGKLGTRHRVSNAERLRLYSLTKSEAVMSSVEHCFATWSYHVNDQLGRDGRLVQVGIRASGRDRAHWEGLGVRQLWAAECLRDERAAIDAVLAHLGRLAVDGVYFSNDIDGTDAAFASATGTPEPGGLTPDFVVDLRALRARRGRRDGGRPAARGGHPRSGDHRRSGRALSPRDLHHRIRSPALNNLSHHAGRSRLAAVLVVGLALSSACKKDESAPASGSAAAARPPAARITDPHFVLEIKPAGTPGARPARGAPSADPLR
jgi:hypothetical protein